MDSFNLRVKKMQIILSKLCIW